jgi:hypothetical protein
MKLWNFAGLIINRGLCNFIYNCLVFIHLYDSNLIFNVHFTIYQLRDLRNCVSV